MLENITHLKLFALVGALLTIPRITSIQQEHYDEEPHFDKDPVPGDSFPHHIFYKRAN